MPSIYDENEPFPIRETSYTWRTIQRIKGLPTPGWQRPIYFDRSNSRPIEFVPAKPAKGVREMDRIRAAEERRAQRQALLEKIEADVEERRTKHQEAEKKRRAKLNGPKGPHGVSLILRKRIYDIIAAWGQCRTAEVALMVDMQPTQIYKHVKIMEKAGLVIAIRKGVLKIGRDWDPALFNNRED